MSDEFGDEGFIRSQNSHAKLPDDVIPVGRVRNYFRKKKVIAVDLFPGQDLEIGTEIFFFRKDTDELISMLITSMEFERRKVDKTIHGNHRQIAILVGVPVKDRQEIYCRLGGDTRREGSFVR